ncbi:hypothetical protein ACIBI9_19440 [Nonomuraea sp. NPDC050451]|uniref:hypothetical protein n=1 Tax=Nonomuraea sp. NPDC050451 TaxID=3364364 RepID=UPI00378C9541
MLEGPSARASAPKLSSPNCATGLDPPESSPEQLFRQINDIKAVMKAHFGYEEGSLSHALHALDAPESDKHRMFGDV